MDVETGSRPEWLEERDYPFESRFLEVDGGRLHYVDEGEGHPILMVHGQPTWSYLYRHLIRGLSPRFRCIAVFEECEVSVHDGIGHFVPEEMGERLVPLVEKFVEI